MLYYIATFNLSYALKYLVSVQVSETLYRAIHKTPCSGDLITLLYSPVCLLSEQIPVQENTIENHCAVFIMSSHAFIIHFYSTLRHTDHP